MIWPWHNTTHKTCIKWFTGITLTLISDTCRAFVRSAGAAIDENLAHRSLYLDSLHTLEGLYFRVDSHCGIVCNPHCMLAIVCCVFSVVMQFWSSTERPQEYNHTDKSDCTAIPLRHVTCVSDRAAFGKINVWKILILYITETCCHRITRFSLFCVWLQFPVYFYTKHYFHTFLKMYRLSFIGSNSRPLQSADTESDLMLISP